MPNKLNDSLLTFCWRCQWEAASYPGIQLLALGRQQVALARVTRGVGVQHTHNARLQRWGEVEGQERRAVFQQHTLHQLPQAVFAVADAAD